MLIIIFFTFVNLSYRITRFHWVGTASVQSFSTATDQLCGALPIILHKNSIASSINIDHSTQILSTNGRIH